LQKYGYPDGFDVTHSVNFLVARGHASGGRRNLSNPARAGLPRCRWNFFGDHDNPAKALSDGANALPLDQLPGLLCG